MYKKIKNIICHPSVIGLYVLDKFSHVFLFFFFCFVIVTSLFAIKDLNTKMFTIDVSNKISSSILADSKLLDTEFKEKKLNGIKSVIEFDDAIIIINDSAYINETRKLVLVFSKSEANGYFDGFHLGKLVYSENELKEFSIKNIKDIDNPSFQERINLEVFVNKLLENCEMNYRSLFFWHDFFNMILVCLFAFGLSYLTASFINKMIVPKIRLKLCLYDTVSYFVMVLFSILFDLDWVNYLGILVCFIYTIVTFSHIKIVAYRKDV